MEIRKVPEIEIREAYFRSSDGHVLIHRYGAFDSSTNRHSPLKTVLLINGVPQDTNEALGELSPDQLERHAEKIADELRIKRGKKGLMGALRIAITAVIFIYGSYQIGATFKEKEEEEKIKVILEKYGETVEKYGEVVERERQCLEQNPNLLLKQK